MDSPPFEAISKLWFECKIEAFEEERRRRIGGKIEDWSCESIRNGSTVGSDGVGLLRVLSQSPAASSQVSATVKIIFFVAVIYASFSICKRHVVCIFFFRILYFILPFFYGKIQFLNSRVTVKGKFRIVKK